jgi:phosphoribosylanthranilate isomerase
LTRAEDAAFAIRHGADYIGLIFAAQSPRRLALAEATDLMGRLYDAVSDPRRIRPVGVFVDESFAEIRSTVESLGLAAVQYHGTGNAHELEAELGVPVLRAIRMRGAESHPEVTRAMAEGPVVLDAFVEGMLGGTGMVFDHNLAIPHIRRGTVFLAGGLNPENIGEVIQRLAVTGALPYAFDLSSGVEVSPGIKSPARVSAFFRALRRAFDLTKTDE